MKSLRAQRSNYIPSPIFHDAIHLKRPSTQSLIKRFASEKLPDFATTDYQNACAFLTCYDGSVATFNTYRREIERLFQWCWFVAKKSALNLKRNDIENYLEFCRNPPKSWIGVVNTARFITANAQELPNITWRPFVVKVSKKAHREGKSPQIENFKLSQAGIKAIFSVLSSFYNFLIQEEVGQINPVLQIRQKSKFIKKVQHQTIIRRLSELQWSYVIETAELMAKEKPEIHERTLFIMTALYSMYLRVSELASSTRWTPKMGDFFRDHDGNWWFKTIGKGNKERIISVSEEMLLALKRYRKSLSLSALPSPAESTPLILNNRNKQEIKSTRGIRMIVQQCFDNTIERMKNDGFTEEADLLLAATVHWLRHTGISDDVKIRPREHVRDDAGHSSSAITDRYIDVELRERAMSARKKKVRPD